MTSWLDMDRRMANRPRPPLLGTLLLWIVMAGCGGYTGGPQAPAFPTIATVSPSSAIVGGSAFTLTVGGSNFASSSVVRWNGSERPTAFVSSTQVTAQISASDIAAGGRAVITVLNAPPGGGSSNPLTFTILLLPRFAYVASGGSNNVSMYTINASTGGLTSIGTIGAGPNPSSVAVDPSGRFAYVANFGVPPGNPTPIPGDVSMYTINASTGALTSTGTISAGTNPFWVAVDQSGRFAYVANGGGGGPTPTPGSVSMYTINTTTGVLTPGGTTSAGGNPVSLALHPSGMFAYVANVNPNVISMYTVDASNGALASIGTIDTGFGPRQVVVEPSGKFAYVTRWDPSDVSMYTVNNTTGALTSMGTIPAGSGPYRMAVDPTGRFAYVANNGSGDVFMYSLNPSSGALTSLGTIAAGMFPNSVAVDPSGKFAYVANGGSNNISMYMIDGISGVLTSAGTTTAGTNPRSIAITGTSP